MPTINTFQDPRFQVIADYLSVKQYERLQDEIARQEERDRQKQLTGTLVGAGVGALTGGLGAGMLAPHMVGAGMIPAFSGTGALTGIKLGAQAGSQFGGGDIAGGVATVAGGVGQAIQAGQEFERYGFQPTPLDKKEISKLFTSMGLTTRQGTAQAKQMGLAPGVYAAQLGQQQAEQRQNDAFEANMASQVGMAREDIRAQDPSGQGDFGSGLQVVQGMRQDQRTKAQEAAFDQRLAKTALFEQMSQTHDMVPELEPAQQALRYRNAVLSPGAGVDAEQRLRLLDRVVKEAEKQPTSYKWVAKQPPSPMEKFQGLRQMFEEADKAGYELRVSVGADGKETYAVTAKDEDTTRIPLSGGGSVRTETVTNRFNENLALGTSMARDLGLVGPEGKPDLAAAIEFAEDATGRSLKMANPEYLANVLARLEAQQAPDITASVDKLEAAVKRAPDIETWTPEKVEQHRGEARQVFDFYLGLLEGGRQLNEAQQHRLDIAKRILEQ